VATDVDTVSCYRTGQSGRNHRGRLTTNMDLLAFILCERLIEDLNAQSPGTGDTNGLSRGSVGCPGPNRKVAILSATVACRAVELVL
jgi:hypothetical protein